MRRMSDGWSGEAANRVYDLHMMPGQRRPARALPPFLLLTYTPLASCASI